MKEVGDMERRDAIKALARAGKYGEVLELIQERAEKVSHRFDDIRSDGTRTDEWRRWALANAASAAFRDLNAELERRANRVVGDDRLDVARVFGTLGVSGDEASKTISRRDAGDRVSTITEPDELRSLLARATRSGDEILARAAAERALEMGDAPTLEQFAADRPDKSDAVKRLWDAERASGDTFRVTMAVSEMLPQEIGGFEMAEQIAAAPEPGAPEAAKGPTRSSMSVVTGGFGW